MLLYMPLLIYYHNLCISMYGNLRLLVALAVLSVRLNVFFDKPAKLTGRGSHFLRVVNLFCCSNTAAGKIRYCYLIFQGAPASKASLHLGVHSDKKQRVRWPNPHFSQAQLKKAPFNGINPLQKITYTE